MLQLRACLGGLGVVKYDLLVEILFSVAERGVVYSQEGELRRDNLRDGRGRHSRTLGEPVASGANG